MTDGCASAPCGPGKRAVEALDARGHSLGFFANTARPSPTRRS